jgi:hypothetical protein
LAFTNLGSEVLFGELVEVLLFVEPRVIVPD